MAAATSACSRGATPSVFLLAVFFIAAIRSVFAENKLAFETWKFRDYEDYDIVKWGTQRGVCPRVVNFCGVEAEDGAAPAPAVTLTREDCVEREKGTTTLLNNVLYKGKFCAIRCSSATDCAPEENCCADPCGTEICVKTEAEAIPRAERRCPGLLQQCPDNNNNKNERFLKCIRSDQFCNGVDDCGDNSDEDESRCQMQYVPVFEYGIQNGSSSICGCVYLLVAAFVLCISNLWAF